MTITPKSSRKAGCVRPFCLLILLICSLTY
nr:MAG TPA: hypothetical protein [Caudoviricetes sp.]